MLDRDVFFLLTGTITVVTVVGGGLTAWWLWLRSRAERFRGAGKEDIRALQDAVAQLRTELDATFGELSAGQQELHERIDFAERLLSQGKPNRTP